MTDTLSRSQKRELTQRRNDAQAVLDHPPSMRFLLRVLGECGYFGDPMTGNSETYHRLGRRMTGIQILQMLETADKDALLKLLQFAAKERARSVSKQEDGNDAE